MGTVISMPSIRTPGKSFGKRRSKRIRMEFQRCTRLTGDNTWPFTQPAAAGTASSPNRANRRRKVTMFLPFLIQIRSRRKKATEHVQQFARAGVNGGLSMFPESTNSRSGKILADRVSAVDCNEPVADWRDLHNVDSRRRRPISLRDRSSTRRGKKRG